MLNRGRRRPVTSLTSIEELESRTLMAAGLTIPAGHQRLWWNAERLDRARAWYQANPFTPAADDAWNNALRYVITGEAQYARNAINRMMAFRVPDNDLNGTKSDTYRWEDWVPVVYDWCYDQVTPAERSEFTDRYNLYAQTMMGKLWGGPGAPGNNYFWGYLRNEFNWAVASYGENPMAETFLNDALVTRWQNAFLPYAASADGAAGGVPPEGSQYGRYLLEYPVVPFTSGGLMGRDLFAETNFYREAMYYLVYATSNGPVANEAGTASFPQIFPYSDDFESEGYPRAGDQYYGDFATAIATWADGTPLEGYARQWLSATAAPVSRYVRAVDDGGAASPFATLPTDYYAPGMENFYARRSWDQGATSLVLQMGEPTKVGHSHFEAGTFQLISGGRWLTKETSGYNGNVVGWGGTGTAGINSGAAHNGLLFNGQGPVSYDYNDAAPSVTRLESRGDYAFASVDLSGAYRAHVRPQVDNPYASRAVRDFVYVRALDALVVLDRMESTGADVAKTFLLHFPTAPTLGPGNTALGVNGDMALKLTSLSPSGQNAPVLRVVDERPASQDNSIDYQWRVEADTTGPGTQSYLLNVMQARGVNDPDLTISMSEDAAGFTITLTHPTRGTAVVRLLKGMASSGGAFGYSASGSPTLAPLTAGVQQMTVTDAGPMWDDNPGAPVISFALAGYNVDETAGTVTVTVTRHGDLSVPVGVNYATSNGTATAGSDYTASSGTLSFAAGETTKTFTLSILNDTTEEGDETINLVLSAPTGGASLGTPSSSTLMIGDDELVAPVAPTGVTAAAASATRVNVNWTDASTRETGFKVERRTGTGGAWAQVGTVGANVTMYADTGVSGSTAYQYRVRAYNSAGDSPYSAAASASTPAGGGPGGGGGPAGSTPIGMFGALTAGSRRLTTLRFADADGTPVIATLKGGGAASMFVLADGTLGFEATGTGTRSALTLKALPGGDGMINLGDSTAAGGLRALKADRANLVGTFYAAGPMGTLVLGGITGGTAAAAGPVNAVTVRGAVSGGRVLAGLNVGADGEAGTADDQAVGGGMRKVSVGGAVIGSVFAAGASAGADGAYGTGDDVLSGGAASAILSVLARGAVDASTVFEAGLFGRALLGAQRVVPSTDPRFILLA